MPFKAKHSAITLKEAEFLKLIFMKGLSAQHVKVSKGTKPIGSCPGKSKGSTNQLQPCAALVQQRKRLSYTSCSIHTQASSVMDQSDTVDAMFL